MMRDAAIHDHMIVSSSGLGRGRAGSIDGLIGCGSLSPRRCHIVVVAPCNRRVTRG
jgi:hypothetical protein